MEGTNYFSANVSPFLYYGISNWKGKGYVAVPACEGSLAVQKIEVRSHRYIRLQGQLGGNTEAFNQIFPKHFQRTRLGLERKTNKSC
eukprot:819934-Pelagomonas_calceolata.AAC.1